MTDYKEFSRQIKEKYPQYKDIDDEKLARAMLEKYPMYAEKITFENSVQPSKRNKGIDLTPGGIYKNYRAFLAAPNIQTREKLLNNKKLSYKEAMDVAKTELEKDPIFKAGKVASDISVYSMLPQARLARGGALANNALTGIGQGAVIGGLEGLKREGAEGILPGVGGGAAFGGTLSAGLPVIGNVASKGIQILPKMGGLLSRTFGRVKPETLEQAVKPTSRALDLNEKQAQNLLMDTTERVQKDYQALMDKAGQDVQTAALQLPEERGVFTSSLKDSLDDIFNGSQVSRNPNLNPAMQGNKDIYKKVNQWIESGATPEKLTAPEMYDLMSNIKRNIPIDWESPTATARNALKQQIYGDYARRLGNLSPELRKANQAFSDLAQFENNEGVRRILQPPKKGDLDIPSSALRNYNSTVTKGNTNRNIQDLEKILVDNGKQPFLNDIDDVNAAMDLLNIRGTGDSWLANMATQATRPVLRGVRAYNRFAQDKNLPELFNAINEPLPRLFTPVIYGGGASLFD